MPFSWKKKTTTRCNRFSQLVADHLQSPKRGGSLVVETGFPTSLIDLYVRNRGRFRKSSAKKQNENDSLTPLSTCSSPGLPLDLNNLSSSSLADSVNLSSGGSDYMLSDEIMEEDVVVRVSEIQNVTETEEDEEKSVEIAKLNPRLVVAFKVLLVVVLVLGTKRFTVGITVSAFVLLFLELVVKLLLGRLSLVKSLEENATLVDCSGVSEIEEQVESEHEVRSENVLDQVRSEVLMEVRQKSSRRAIMKSRMKKLVPKKLLKASTGSKEAETVKPAQGHKTFVFSRECSDSEGATLRILKQNKVKIVEIEGRRSLSSALSNEIDCNDKELGRGLRQDSGCLVLCLIVLVGLIGGRVLALVLALSWCLMLKKLQWRNVKFPIS